MSRHEFARTEGNEMQGFGTIWRSSLAAGAVLGATGVGPTWAGVVLTTSAHISPFKFAPPGPPNQAQAFTDWNANAIQGLMQGDVSVGNPANGPAAYYPVTTVNHRDVFDSVVNSPTFPSWRGTADPAAPFNTSYGNAVDFSLRIVGLESEALINQITNGFYDAIGSYRRPVNYDTGGKQLVAVSADVLLKGPKTAEGDHFFSAGIAAVDDNGDEVGEMAISSDGDLYGYSGNGFVPTFLTSIDVKRGEWHNLAIVVDFGGSTYSFFVDGEFIDSFPFDPQLPSTVLKRGSLVAYAAPDTATRKKDEYTAHYDNFAIEVVPTPRDEK